MTERVWSADLERVLVAVYGRRTFRHGTLNLQPSERELRGSRGVGRLSLRMRMARHARPQARRASARQIVFRGGTNQTQLPTDESSNVCSKASNSYGTWPLFALRWSLLAKDLRDRVLHICLHVGCTSDHVGTLGDISIYCILIS